ncbi:MAG: hypothetical protein JSV84_07160 [Gemmatimonadota bacterium]|nr:MAG: hypothetical protein JSV84_07160 [Gemmatimonadota bacterium]
MMKQEIFLKKKFILGVCFCLIVFIPFILKDVSFAPGKVSLELLEISEESGPFPKVLTNDEMPKIQGALAKTFMEFHPGGDNRQAFSTNGHYKAIKSYYPKHPGAGEKEGEWGVLSSLLNKDEREIWKGETEDAIYISNNGQNFVSTNSNFGQRLDFYAIESLEPINTYEMHLSGGHFSDDGGTFLAWSKDLHLFTSEGQLLWKREFSRHSDKKAIISSAGSYISINDRLTRPKAKKEQTEKIPSEVGEVRAIPMKGTVEITPSNEAYLTLLRKDGSILREMLCHISHAHEMAFSPYDGEYLIVGGMNKLLFFETETASLLWEREVGPPYYWISSVALSAEYIAASIIEYHPTRGGPVTYRFVLFDLQGQEVDAIEMEAPEDILPENYIHFSERGEYIICRAHPNVYTFKMNR